MTATMSAYWPFIVVCLIGIAFVAGLLYYASRPRNALADEQPMSFKWSYLFLWPLLFDWFVRDPERRKHLLTRREWIGWVIVAVLIIAFVLLNPHRAS